MNALGRYLRSRAVPATTAVVAACAAGLWALNLATDHPQSRSLAALLAALAATAAVAPGLSGPDPDLDRVAAIAWPPRRAAHVIIAAAAVTALLASASRTGHQPVGIGPLTRNVTGLAGLTALGATALGAARAPLLPILWAALVLPFTPPMGEPPTRPAAKVVLTWMVQPTTTQTASFAAITLATAGTVAYAVLGSNR